MSVQVLLPSSMCVSDGLWLEEKEGTNGERWLLGAGVSAMRLHRHREQRPGDAATQPGGQGTQIMKK